MSKPTIEELENILSKPDDYYKINPSTMSGGLTTSIRFKYKLKRAAEDGLLIFVRWGLALVLAFYALNALTSIISGATNGTQSALYLNELQNKGYLPKVVNGVVPDRTENATPNTVK